MVERIFMTVVLILISLLASFGISMLQGLFLSTPPAVRLAYSATMGVVVATSWWRWQWQALATAPSRRAASARVVTMACLCAHGVALASNYWAPVTDRPDIEWALAGPWRPITAVLLAGVTAPLLEESLFRGFLLQQLRSRLGAAASVILSAGAFAVAHGDPTRTLPHFVGGLLLGAITLRTGRLWLAVLTHGALNMSVAVFQPLYVFGVPTRATIAFPLLNIAAALLAMLGLRHVLLATPWNTQRGRGRPVALPLTWDLEAIK